VDRRKEATARKAAKLDAAMRLCPQACPIPGSASYSALKITRRPPDPTSEEKAVGRE
jgi:hypothetical protein